MSDRDNYVPEWLEGEAGQAYMEFAGPDDDDNEDRDELDDEHDSYWIMDDDDSDSTFDTYY